MTASGIAARASDYRQLRSSVPPSPPGPGGRRIRPAQALRMSPDLESTSELLVRIRQGDTGARDALIKRYLPVLTRWARGRLPGYARDVMQTDDLVQETLTACLKRLNEFELRHEGAFLAYLRSAFLNRMRDEIRRVHRGPAREALAPEIEDHRRSVVEEAIGREALERYEKALSDLSPEQREAVMLRFEFGYTHLEVARATGKPSANAARMVVARALVHLIEAMDEFRT